MDRNVSYKNFLWILMALSFVVRAVLAYVLEFGNDEVYYRLYALYPQWSYFDHPLMVALVMRIFSFNLLLQSEFFFRLGSVVLGTFNIWTVYKIAETIKNERTGFIAALLYTSSVYVFVITGIFILPDTPQSTFWLLALHFMLKSLPCPEKESSHKQILFFGLFAGLGIISKYTSVFLWSGAVLYIIFYKRSWLKKKSLYLSLLITVVVSLPVLIWNLENDFISFTFHGERVDFFGHGININTFLREISGEILYNNPVNFVLIILSVFAFFRGKLNLKNQSGEILLFTALPLIVLFIVFSLFRPTLPHWTAPGYTTLVFIAAVWLAGKSNSVVPASAKVSLGLLAVVLLLGTVQIKTGFLYSDNNKEITRKGHNDPSLDMYGYHQIGKAFEKIVVNDRETGKMSEKIFLTGNKWFPLANFDYYAASPLDIKTLAIGKLQDIHQYAWINKLRGGFKKGYDAYYITDSRIFRPPGEEMKKYFEKATPPDTIPIYRNGKIVKYAFVYRFKNLKKIPPSIICKRK